MQQDAPTSDVKAGRPRKRALGRATISDVARIAGVSPMTVSRALKDSTLVTRELRERVAAAVEQLGYVPNLVRWPVIGFLIAAGDPELMQTSARVRFAGSREGRAAMARMDDEQRAVAEQAAEADAQAMSHAFTSWRRHDGIVKVASRLGWVLVGLAVLRLSIQIPLYLQGAVEALGVAKLVLGWPAYLLAVGAGALLLMRGHTPLDAPTSAGANATDD